MQAHCIFEGLHPHPVTTMRGAAAVERAASVSGHAQAATPPAAASTEAEGGTDLDPDEHSAAQPQYNPGSSSAADSESSFLAAADEPGEIPAGGPGGLQLVCSSPTPQQLLMESATSGSPGHAASTATDGEYCINLVS